MKTRKVWIVLGVVFAVVLAALYIFIYMVPQISGALTETAVAYYDHMRIVKHVNAVIIRDEEVIYAPKSGNISYYVDDNIRTRKGIKVCDIYGSETTSMLCPVTGVVSFYVDGYENILTPETMPKTLDLVPTDAAISVFDISKTTINAGDIAYKLIKSDTWYVAMPVPLAEFDEFVKGSKVTLEFADAKVEAVVSDCYETGQTCLVIVSTGKYYKDYDKLRNVELDVVLHDDAGLIIPNTAITYEDEKPGVYLKGLDGEYSFVRVKIINTDGTNSVVAEGSFGELRADGLTDTIKTINIYDEILKDASEKN
ncbi:MAG: hypothetical protein IKZ78_00900 [Firmicutes bacterium]|nr:hypothetical protein [Bacillota bacterium]